MREQAIDLTKQVTIFATCLLEEFLAQLRRAVECGVVQRFDLLPPVRLHSQIPTRGGHAPDRLGL